MQFTKAGALATDKKGPEALLSECAYELKIGSLVIVDPINLQFESSYQKHHASKCLTSSVARAEGLYPGDLSLLSSPSNLSLNSVVSIHSACSRASPSRSSKSFSERLHKQQALSGRMTVLEGF